MLCSQGKKDRNEIREKGSRVRRAHTQPTGSALLALMSLIYPRLITWEGTFTNNKSLHRLESCLIMSVCGHMRGIPVSVCLSVSPVFVHANGGSKTADTLGDLQEHKSEHAQTQIHRASPGSDLNIS